MSDSQEESWSDNRNAPRIPYDLYFKEKTFFAGMFIATILYGVVIVLFFQCMTGLFNTANRRRAGVRWGLVSYTALMFSFGTVLTAMGLNIESISFIDNRDFPGVKGVLPPGPLGYQMVIYPTALNLVPSLMFLLNYWLADGLLLYRCFIIYSMNRWVISFPCLIYLGSVATGVTVLVSQARGSGDFWVYTPLSLRVPYVSISVSLNVLLTLMIVIRLALYGRNIRNATGTPAGINGLCRSISTMLIESSALYAVSSLLLIGLWVANSGAANIFLPIVCETQVIAPLLIVKRVADRRALTSNTIVTGCAFPPSDDRGEPMGGDGALPGGGSANQVDNCGRNSVAGVAVAIDLYRESKV